MKFKLIFFALFVAFTTMAQRTGQADALFNSKQYAKARVAYELLLKQKPQDSKLNFRNGICCDELKDHERAIMHFEMAGVKFPERDVYLGRLYFDTYRFDLSTDAYQRYISTLNPDDTRLASLQSKLAKSQIAARLIAKVNNITIVDSLVLNKTEFLKFYKSGNELGALHQELLKLNARTTVDKVSYITQRKDRAYFSAIRNGQLDIFTSYKLLDKWSDTLSISTVLNTPANENYPFLLLDGITLYYASDNELSIGGYDIFVTRFTPTTNSYLSPENIGFPFNSPANDYMMVIDEQRKLGWFATDRNQPAEKVMIFTFVPNENSNIIRSENKDSIRNVAQLKTYRKMTVTNSNHVNLPTINKAIVGGDNIKFVVNDSVVYSHLNEFKSPDAIKLWNEKEKISQNLVSSKQMLDNLRQKYENAQTPNEFNGLKILIEATETKLTEIEKSLTTTLLKLRNDENQLLRK